ncbi:outer membrane lipoprotein-sorting protein [Catenuloplanes atrovinosus]|uniref:Outer membrane lipoprotein-sorting protein n=2 Tax=Catenuloplanes atrovinosus TaxID=137266 RepID=A0AAE4C7Q1_9ACTN|nr:outer membrane lipoprotein-sorting protein [Catenuloplanes atrovinosus]
MKSQTARRWLIPAAAAVAVIGGGAAVGALAAGADPVLPQRSAAELLVDLQNAKVDGLSGTVVQTADLGLPGIAKLAADVGGETGSLGSLISGENTLRVWHSEPDKSRVALVGTLGQTDVIRNGTDVWIWQSAGNTAQHWTVPAGQADEAPAPMASGLPSTPQEAADQALAAVDPTTEVVVGRSAKVAGRDAYELILRPRDTTSLVGEVRLAIDAEHKIPLRAEIIAKKDNVSAFKVAFTQVDFGRPDAAQFAFNPPPGGTVTEGNSKALSAEEHDAEPTPEEQAEIDKLAEAAKPKTIGEGWTTVFTADLAAAERAVPADAVKPENAPEGAPDELPAAQLEALSAQFPEVSGAWGKGRLLSGNLFSVLFTDDGKVYGGLVAPEKLYEVAAND